ARRGGLSADPRPHPCVRDRLTDRRERRRAPHLAHRRRAGLQRSRRRHRRPDLGSTPRQPARPLARPQARRLTMAAPAKSRTLYVGGLPPSASPEALREAWTHFGPIHDVRLIPRRELVIAYITF